ncbi:MAG TPA: response regulator transcription factor [Chthoniobacter sp.]|nr:response regulator transcription factor [Chthoniobacter sp.]
MRNTCASQSDVSHLPTSSSPLRGTILIVDRNSEHVESLVEGLEASGFAVETAENGEDALALAQRIQPALIITEVTLDGISGVELCRSLRADPTTEGTQVIMLTTRQSEEDRIEGFEAGADGYVAKPCSARELVLRVKAVQRRTRPLKGQVVHAGPISVDHARCCALVDGAAIDLTPTEFRLLATLAEKPNVVQTRDKLLSEVWGNENAIENRSVDTYLRRLRNKLGNAGQHIKTVYGFGYRIAC